MNDDIINFVEKKSNSLDYKHLYSENGLDLLPNFIYTLDNKVYVSHEKSNIITLMIYNENNNTTTNNI